MRRAAARVSPTRWKMRRPRTFEVSFFLSFVICLGASIGAGFGWRNYMDGCCAATIGTRSYTFIPWLVSFAIFFWTIVDIVIKYKRVEQVMRLLTRFMSVYRALYSALADPATAAYAVLRVRRTDSGAPPNTSGDLHMQQSVQEVAIGLLASMVLLLWQSARGYGDPTPEAAETIVNTIAEGGTALVVQDGGADGRGGVLVEGNFSLPVEFGMYALSLTDDYPCTMLAAIKRRATIMGEGCAATLVPYPPVQSKPPAVPMQMLGQSSRQALDAAIFSLETDIRNFFADGSVRNVWRGVSVPIAIMGILLSFFIQPVFYSTMGENIVYIGPVICVFVTGAVLFNVCMADPLASPSTLHYSALLEQLRSIVEYADLTHDFFFADRSSAGMLPVQTQLRGRNDKNFLTKALDSILPDSYTTKSS